MPADTSIGRLHLRPPGRGQGSGRAQHREVSWTALGNAKSREELCRPHVTEGHEGSSSHHTLPERSAQAESTDIVWWPRLAPRALRDMDRPSWTLAGPGPH